MHNQTRPSTPPVWGVIAAFAAVYVIWGSTYLGIRYAVGSIPPFLMAGTRNLAAGLLLYAFARVRGGIAPTRIEWRDAAISGGLLLTIGNGGVTWAEQVIPSSVTALLVALTPLWMVLFDWLRPGGPRPRPFVIAGLTVGFMGVALLAHGHGNHPGPAYGWGMAALMAASMSWAFGSIFSRQAHKPASPLLGVAMQMIAGGSLLLVIAFARGEVMQFSPGQVTWLSAGSWLYLTAAGSLVGYTCYVWLLHATTPARVATYAYVNPFIAVLLGCTIGRETFSHELFVAGTLIIAAVMLIVRGGARRAAAETPSKEVA
ncbi:MAG TPA: EamA family transporter [Verrucomicrobiae bacterium]|nr:EamA family transporter [Verrucomicrobiae bacterium]